MDRWIIDKSWVDVQVDGQLKDDEGKNGEWMNYKLIDVYKDR